MFNKSFIIIFLVLIFGCEELSIKENVVDNYYLVALDKSEELSLSYHESIDESNYGIIIKPTVYAIGYNEKFIIVKQHPRAFPNPPDRAITNYFILPIKKGFDWRTNNGLIGPLTLEEFNKKRKDLNVPSTLKFTIEKENLK